MVTETRAKIERKITEKVPLTLDERVYYHETNMLVHLNSDKEPVMATYNDVVTMFSKYGRTVTEQDVIDWLDNEKVPK